MIKSIRFRLNYVARPWRTWYIITLAVIAALWFDSVIAGFFVALATLDVEVERASSATPIKWDAKDIQVTNVHIVDCNTPP